MVLRTPFRVEKGGSGSRGIGWGCRAKGASWDWSIRAPAERNPAFRRTPLKALPLRGRACTPPYRCGVLSPRGVSGVVVGVCGWTTGFALIPSLICPRESLGDAADADVIQDLRHDVPESYQHPEPTQNV